jgi:hypothetical protein
MEVSFAPPLKSIDAFDINQFINFPFIINKKRGNIIYYRCKFKKICNCSATCKVSLNLDLSKGTIKIEGEHNHESIVKPKLLKRTVQKVDDIIEKNNFEKPAIIEKILLQNATTEELQSTTFPTRRQISHRKTKFIHSSYPTSDHIWNSLIEHGNFDGSTKFVKFFSLIPFIIIMITEEGMIRMKRKNNIAFIDGTHSTANPSMHLLSIMLLNEEGNGLIYYF